MVHGSQQEPSHGFNPNNLGISQQEISKNINEAIDFAKGYAERLSNSGIMEHLCLTGKIVKQDIENQSSPILRISAFAQKKILTEIVNEARKRPGTLIDEDFELINSQIANFEQVLSNPVAMQMAEMMALLMRGQMR